MEHVVSFFVYSSVVCNARWLKLRLGCVDVSLGRTRFSLAIRTFIEVAFIFTLDNTVIMFLYPEKLPNL